MNHASIIVRTKLLVPPRRPEWLRRSRLLDHLHAHIDRKLIVVAAPAGYGKSTLLADFAHEVDVPVCWYRLDEYDADPRVFLDHLVASIQCQFPDFGQRIQAALRNTSDVQGNVYPLAAVMANDIYEISDYLVIVLDDFHYVEGNETINQFLSLVLRYAEENFHLIIASRTLPAIPDQALMVAQREMIGMGVEDLRFSPAEIQALVKQNYGLDMPADRAEDLARHSNGWITGILLTAHQATWQKIIEGAVRLPEASGRVYDYLAEQVLDRQPPELRQFLLESAVLEEITAAGCDALLGRQDSARCLEEIARKNLFIVAAEETTYTYHPLFREFLRKRLRRGHPERYRELLLRLAQDHEAREKWERAIALYMELGLYEEAADALERAERALFEAGRWDTLVSWLDALPRSLFLSRPHLMICRGRIHAERGELEAALDLYERCRREFQEGGDRYQEGRVHLMQALALFLKGHYTDALTRAQEAMGALEELPDGPERQRLEGSLQDCVGVCHYFLGRPADAIPYLEGAARVCQAAEDDFGAASALHDLGISHRALGRLEAAMTCYRQALRYWERVGNPARLSSTLNSLGMVYYLQGEWDEAERIYLHALEQAEQGGMARLEATILASLGDLQRDRGNYQQALETYARAQSLAEKCHHSYMLAYILQARAEVARLMSNYAQAELDLSEALQRAEEIRSDYTIGLCHLARGALDADRGQPQEALASLGRALEIFRQAGFRHEEARAHLHTAHALSLLGREEEALAHLGQVAELVEQLGYDHFLVVDGRHMPVVLRLGAEAGLGQGRFARALERAVHAPETPARPPAAPALTATAGQALRVYTFGRVRIFRDDREVTTQRELVKELFFYLLAHHPHPVRKDQVMEELWSGYSRDRANSAVRVALYRLRRVICPVNTRDGWLVLELPPDTWYDVWAFEEALRQAREAAGNPDRQAACYERALALYKGPYLEQVTSTWVLGERERLQGAYLDALLSLARLKVAAHECSQAIALCQQVLEHEPYHEEAWRGLLRAYSLSGNRAAAIDAFHQLLRLLREDLGIDPSPETQALYRQILDMEV